MLNEVNYDIGHISYGKTAYVVTNGSVLDMISRCVPSDSEGDDLITLDIEYLEDWIGYHYEEMKTSPEKNKEYTNMVVFLEKVIEKIESDTGSIVFCR